MPDACKDRWVCTRKWRDPQLDDSGRLACSTQRCLGDDPFEANFLLRFSGPPCLSPPGVWTGILTSTTEDMRRG
jgi:hypothetical protein